MPKKKNKLSEATTVSSQDITSLITTQTKTDNDYDILDFATEKLLLQDYLNGISSRELSQKYNISTRAVSAIAKRHPRTCVQYEKEIMQFNTARENERISDIKMRFFDVCQSIIENIQNQEVISAGYLDQLLPTMNSIDKMQRLNQEKATDITQNNQTTKTIDMASVLQELNTPEAKRDFLLKQINVNKQ